jgi:hypothetical protein
MKAELIQSALTPELEEQRRNLLDLLEEKKRAFLLSVEPITAQLAMIERLRPQPRIMYQADTPEEVAQIRQRLEAMGVKGLE